VQVKVRNRSVHQLLTEDIPADVVWLAWLGQAGFALRFGNRRLLIDPYLSDHLARKYAGTQFPHQRLMPSPIAPTEVLGLDWVFCSHRHSDHMDPGTLPTLAALNPDCKFIVPSAERALAVTIGLPEDRLLYVNAGDRLDLAPDIAARVIPAAHEELKCNDLNEHHFLGYVLTIGGLTIYHSGDCVRYPGQVGLLGPDRIDLALLPVNGRSEFLKSRGVPGNMTFDEARELCRDARIEAMIPHHFGLFEFNTADPGVLARKIAEADSPPKEYLPAVDQLLELSL
jgi:L-ascorbate metabolism protein UlaG (beta-lactamase superfamily)